MLELEAPNYSEGEVLSDEASLVSASQINVGITLLRHTL
jgi:hypothetical protein